MNRRRKVESVSHDRWLVSYADFITLLLAFFIVLYSSARVDNKRVGQLSTAIKAAFQELGAFPLPKEIRSGLRDPNISLAPSHDDARAAASPATGSAPESSLADANADMASIAEHLREALAKEIDRNEVSIRVAPEGLILSLREVGFFDSGSAQMRPQAQVAFSRVVEILRQQRHQLRIEGHTDNLPIHTVRFTSNWELSTARATEVVRLLVTRYGFSPERMSAAGYGEFRPVADNSTVEGRESNRRVDVVLLSGHQQP